MILQKYPAVLINKESISENTIEMTFSIEHPDFTFVAGQYVSICIPSLSDVSAIDRCHDFSIASSPSNPKKISIAFRGSQSIFKTTLLALPFGEVVKIDGPKGVFTLPVTPVPQVVFVAGGIGITPMLSMIQYATETSSAQKITLIYYNTSTETTAYSNELKTLESRNKNFILYELVGIPDKNFLNPHIKSAKNTTWYISGAPKMVTYIRQILLDSGIIQAQINFEEFSGYEK